MSSDRSASFLRSRNTNFIDFPQMLEPSEPESNDAGVEVEGWEDVEDLEVAPGATKEGRRAHDAFVNSFMPGLTRDLARQYYHARHTGQDFYPLLAAQRLASRTMGLHQVKNTGAERSRDDQRSPQLRNDNPTSAPGTSGWNLSHRLHTLEEGCRILKPSTSDGSASASIIQAAVLARFSALGEYRARLSQYVADTTRSGVRARTTNPQFPRMRRRNHGNIRRHIHEGPEEMYEAIALPSQSVAQSTSLTPRRPSTPVNRRSPAMFNNSPVYLRRQKIRPRCQTGSSAGIPDQNHVLDPTFLDAVGVEDLQAVPIGMPYRKRRRAVGPMEHAGSSRSSIAAQHFSENRHGPYPSLPFGPGRRGWPAGRVPVEVFNAITGYLARESVQAMRLVNREFEVKASNRHFHTVVVPFRPEIYGMMTHKSEGEDIPKPQVKAKGKAKGNLIRLPEGDKGVHDGMKVFEAWGPHIKRFAMAFEVDEATLENAPVKGKFEHHMTWWGGYKWPHPYYNRYEFCEGLEKKADEFRCMSKALSYLAGTRELGLSLDSGLGWLVGPDISDRAKLFQAKSQVFRKPHSHSEPETSEREEVLQGVERSLDSPAIVSPVPLDLDGFVEVEIRDSGQQRTVSLVPINDQQARRPLVFDGVDLGTTPADLDHSDRGRYAVEGLGALAKADSGHFATAALQPKNLTLYQHEWLLETEWAQRAFLSSFCMALADNSYVFRHVHSLNISKLSSRYLSALRREDVWNALPNLSSVTIYVSADWRNIMKSDTGLVDAPTMHPSNAAMQLYTLLDHHIAKMHNIKTLSIGYVGGGEHQAGIFGRNKFILPAPLMDYSDPAAILKPLTTVLNLPHVELLTFSNCWMTPQVLKIFAAQLRHAKLRFLNLESVSLTSSLSTDTEAINISPSNGTFDASQGPPCRDDPAVGNFFQQRHWDVPDPGPNSWAVKGQRIDSWGNVIDAITPGATMDFIRYAFRYHDEPPSPRFTNLERLSFESCGYVRLTNYKDFHQQAIDEVSDQLPAGLVKRAVDLYSVMMSCPSDVLLGQIVPALKAEEQEVLTSAFPMRLGWLPEKFGKSLDNLEDGQPLGGSGRFSGVIEKLVLPSPGM
ncbi:MAG: hypothetical protein Q9217_000704 [Psora testacea]